MSLKAKIEAVIYAAEEPVTLAQLSALFQAELLEARETRSDAEAATRREFEAESAVAEARTLDLDEMAMPPVDPPPDDETTGEKSADPPANSPPDDEKRAARQRDRDARDEAKLIVTSLIDEYAQNDRGIEIREIAGGYRVATKPEYHDAVRAFVKSLKPPMKLSLQALETLAVIAYKQPVTAPEVSEIRGVDSGGVLGSLVGRKLITTAGRKQVIGRPILYKTTKEFLLRFGLKDLNELPSIEEFEKMAGELADTEDVSAPVELPFETQSAEDAPEASEDAETALPEVEQVSDVEQANDVEQASVVEQTDVEQTGERNG